MRTKIQDLWLKGPRGNRVRTARWGKGKRYLARWEEPTSGLGGSKTFDSKAEAEAWLHHIQEDVEQGRLLDTSTAKKITLYDWTAQYLEHRSDVLPATKAQMRSSLKHLDCADGHIPLAQIKPANIDAILNQVSGGAMRAKVRSLINQAVDYAVMNDVLKVSPLAKMPKQRKVRRLREIRPLTPDELRAIIDALPLEHRLMVEVLATTGMRGGELRALAEQDVDLDAGVFIIRRAWKGKGHLGFLGPTKGGTERRVPIAPQLIDRLDLHLKHNLHDPKKVPLEDGSMVERQFVFPGRNQGKYTPVMHLQSFRETQWTEALRKAGMRHVVLHDLRHTYASAMIRAGADIKQLQATLGHANAAVTLDIYGHLMDNQSDQMGSMIGKFFYG